MGKISVGIIGSVGLPARYGGFETLVNNLSYQLRDTFNLHISAEKKLESKKNTLPIGLKLYYINIRANGWQSVFHDLAAILKVSQSTKNILLLGVGICPFLFLLKPLLKLKVICHIDGIEWKRNKWNILSKAYLRFALWCAYRVCNHLVIDNEQLLKVLPKPKNNYSIIKYGGHPDTTKAKSTGNVGYFLTIARATPENNLELIANAVIETRMQWKLVSNFKNNRYGEALKKKYSGYKNIECINAIYDETKLHQIRSNCKAYIHGHSAGGTNPSLVEIMFYPKPVFCYNATFNISTTFGMAKYFSNSSDLAGLLINVDGFSHSLEMLKKAQTEYDWNKICAEYESLFYHIFK